MLPLHYARHWRIASAILLMIVLIAAVVPAVWFWPDSFDMVKWLRNIDKWTHALTFAFLTVWFAGQYRPRSYWRIAIGLIGFGLLIELCQRYLSYRTSEWPDVGADVIGIGVGLIIALGGAGGWCRLFEGWYLRRKAEAGID